MMPTSRLALCLSLLVAPACDDDPSGTAPSIDDLALTPTKLAVGEMTEVQGSLHFTDPDADIRDLEITLTPPNGAPSAVEVPIAGARDKTDADLTFIFAISAPQAGRYKVSAVLIDAEGHMSAPADGELTAE